MNIVLFERHELVALTGSVGARFTVSLPRRDRRYAHITKILKLSPGDTFRAGVIDETGGCRALVARIDSERIDVHLTTIDPVAADLALAAAVPAAGSMLPTAAHATVPATEPSRAMRPAVAVDIVLGHPRPIVLQRLLRDLTTVGVGSIHCAIAALSERSYAASGLWTDNHFREWLIQGAEQAGDPRLPRVTRYHRSADAFQAVAAQHLPGFCWCCHHHPEAGYPTLWQALRTAAHVGGGDDSRVCSVAVAIGPERGWTADEIQAAEAVGWQTVALGGRILKTETAAVVAAAACVAAAL